MTQTYDIVAMGAGHNGLVAAAYLAKAGKKVLVLERKAWPGGGVSTRQLNTPGYWHDEHSSVHIMIQGNPMLRQDELGLLSKHGLKYHYSSVPHATIFPDQSVLFTYKDIDKTCESFATVSARDAETYRDFVKISQKILQVFMPGLYGAPPPLGELVAMLDRSEEGRLMLDYMNRDCLDLVNQLYESDKIKIHLLRLVSENLQAPNELGKSMGVLLMLGIIHTYGVSQPVGGSAKLTEALVRCIESYGGEVRCNAEVSKILTSAGRATGVQLVEGEQIFAKDGVIGAIHPHVIRKFVDGVPEPVTQRAERATLASFSIMVSHYDLKENARFHAGDEVGYAKMLEFMATDRLDEMLADFDDLKRGVITERRLCAGGDESIGDKTRVPTGAGMFHGITFAPYHLSDKRWAGRQWDEFKEEIGDLSLAHYRKFVSNLTADNIVARSIVSPVDLERSSPNSMMRGDLHGVAPYFYQSAGHRPTPDLGQYTVPGVERLYLAGPFQHPGGGVYGAGRATAIRMFEQLGMDFGSVAASVRQDTGVPSPVANVNKEGMVLRGAADEELIHVESLERVGNELVIKGKSFGTMPMEARLHAASARAGLKMLGASRLAFLATLPFRRGGQR
ncbi:phytoene dehydrogenase [Robbsia andropogonis]|uniref:Pyridine nucleotide-disulfide oxidoreductase domain-containing protein 2 n=1 Tax=Robbsia andropogonis TaxID=28092 RepID=A0A0F5JW28_9BURK|nr:NAD(P)/FAD-dependent oxidoreductase [Robbsia andropogonis]KKB61859.1 phytoene dehydrogenase [Robbsia andropogonis]MCP1118656.1 NAD(P)/FAD-dependent oxidoreductase [Robbsia andropogonis]MCP1128123.1 NAD(P)/FAD-dependent oxidoreductase [Robbsia andropogonis]